MGVWTTFPTQGGMAVFRYGWVGVHLFLVISGFDIGLAALRKFDAKAWPFADRLSCIGWPVSCPFTCSRG